MLDSVLTWIYAAGVLQAIFLGFALATIKVRNHAAAALLSAMMAVMAVLLIEQLADAVGAKGELALSLALEFGLAPLFYLFVKALVAPAEYMPVTAKAAQQILTHFIPLGGALVVLVAMHAANKGGNLGIAHAQFGRLIIFLVFVKLWYFIAYACVTERVLRLAAASSKASRAGVLRWIYRWLLMVFAAIAVSYAAFILYLVGAPIWRDSDAYAALIVSLVIFSIAYFVLANRKALDFTPQPAATTNDADRRNADLIKSYIESERPYLEPDFSIKSVCTATNLSPSAAVSAITALSGAGFQEFVNRLRLGAFEQFSAAPENKSKTTLELAFAAGFNSKATFYRAFKAEFGMEPKKLREKMKIA